MISKYASVTQTAVSSPCMCSIHQPVAVPKPIQLVCCSRFTGVIHSKLNVPQQPKNLSFNCWRSTFLLSNQTCTTSTPNSWSDCSVINDSTWSCWRMLYWIALVQLYVWTLETARLLEGTTCICTYSWYGVIVYKLIPIVCIPNSPLVCIA